MKTNKIIFLTFLLLVMGFLTFRFTLSYFSDSGNSSDNVLSASAEFPTVTPTTTPTPPPVTPTPQIANHVVISEVQLSKSGTGNTDNDFIELYNPTSSAFNLKGHRLVKRSGSSPNDTDIKVWLSDAFIPAHGFYLWANDSIGSSIRADAITTDTIAASNSIALRLGDRDTGTIIDALSWNSASQSLKEGTEFSPDPADNGSMERKAYSTSNAATMEGGADSLKGNGFDAGNNATDFITRTISEPQYSTSSAEIP